MSITDKQIKNDKIVFFNWAKQLTNSDLYYELFEQIDLPFNSDPLWKFKRETLKSEFHRRLKLFGFLQ